MRKKADSKINKAQAQAAYVANEIIVLGKHVHWGDTTNVKECIKNIFPNSVKISRSKAAFSVPVEGSVSAEQNIITDDLNVIDGPAVYSVPYAPNRVLIDFDGPVVEVVEGLNDAQREEINSLMRLAADKGYEDIVMALIDTAGASVDSTDLHGKSALHYAAEHGHTEAVSILLKRSANPYAKDKGNDTPLHYAASNGHIAVVKELLKWQPNLEAQDIKEEEITPLHYAANKNHLAVVEALIAAGAKVDAKGPSGYTPLFWAAQEGHLTVVEALITAGANLNERGTDNYTPLHLAAIKGHPDVVDRLIAAGVKVNARGLSDFTPLHLAAAGGHLAVVEVLIAAGADVTAKLPGGFTPLHLAASGGHVDVVTQLADKLVENSKSLDVKDKNGCTPLNWAEHFGYTGIISVLKKKGAAPPLRQLGDTSGTNTRNIPAVTLTANPLYASADRNQGRRAQDLIHTRSRHRSSDDGSQDEGSNLSDAPG